VRRHDGALVLENRADGTGLRARFIFHGIALAESLSRAAHS